MQNKENTTTDPQKSEKTQIVRDGLKRTYRSLNDKEIENKSYEAVLAPQGRMLSIEGKPVSVSELRQKIAQTIATASSSNATAEDLDKAQDLQMMVARSIETINSETSSSQEYFRWLDETGTIIKHMNDGHVSEADLKERNDFLSMSHQRETELLVCLALYSGSSSPQAAEQAKVIRYKLVKLREMRSAIEHSTKNHADAKITEEDYYRAIPYYKYTKGLAKLPFGYDLAAQQKRYLGLEHDDDPDLNNDQALQERLMNEMLDELFQEDATDFTNILGPEYQQTDNTNDFIFSMADSFAQGTPSQAEAYGIDEGNQNSSDHAAFSADSNEKGDIASQRSKETMDKIKELAGRKRQFILNYYKAAQARA